MPRGRPLGSVNRITREIAERLLEDGGITPLEMMVRIMRERYDAGEYELALSAAQSSARYMHAAIQPRQADDDDVADAATAESVHTDGVRERIACRLLSLAAAVSAIADTERAH